MDDLARIYVGLADAIEQHWPGYIDGYFGPAGWRTGAKRPLAALAGELDELARSVDQLDSPERRAFLSAQVRAMQAAVALLRGEQLPYRDEVRRLFDIEPAPVPEAQFDEAIAALNDLLPGPGSIAEREQAFRARFAVPPDRLPALFDATVAELGRRTRALWDLPPGESVEVQLVTDKPWRAYNWYLGGYRSRIEVNTDLPVYLIDLPEVIAHEVYPGHHTERALKERRLYREAGRAEHSILLLGAPEAVVSEGIATRALEMVMSRAELQEWLAGELSALAGLTGLDVERRLQLREIKKAFEPVAANAALLLHEQGASEQDVLRYLQRYWLQSEPEARQTLRFIAQPDARAYIFTYTGGGELLDRLFAQGDAPAWFARVLHEPVTPAVIRGWLERDAAPEASSG